MINRIPARARLESSLPEAPRCVCVCGVVVVGKEAVVISSHKDNLPDSIAGSLFKASGKRGRLCRRRCVSTAKLKLKLTTKTNKRMASKTCVSTSSLWFMLGQHVIPVFSWGGRGKAVPLVELEVLERVQ